MGFKVGEKAVHKIHGVGQICGVETLNYGAGPQDYYLMKIFANGITVRFPKDVPTEVVRGLVSDEDISRVFIILQQPGQVQASVWNKRKKGLSEKIKSGGIVEIAEVLRDLSRRRNGKELSFGEKEMWEKARNRIVLEISAARATPTDAISAEIDRVLS